MAFSFAKMYEKTAGHILSFVQRLDSPGFSEATVTPLSALPIARHHLPLTQSLLPLT
jgi:hypothetical protein